MKKFLTCVLLFLAVVIFASWQYRLVCLLLIVLLNKRWIKSLPLMQVKHAYGILIAVLLVGIYICIPNYFQRGRTQLVYLNQKGERVATPLHLYALNVIFPEKEIMNFCMKGTAILPPENISPLKKAIGSGLIYEAKRDF